MMQVVVGRISQNHHGILAGLHSFQISFRLTFGSDANSGKEFGDQ